MVLAWSKFPGIYNGFELNRSVHGSVRSLLMASLNLDKKTLLDLIFPQWRYCLSLCTHKDIIKDNVNVQEYLECIKSKQKVHWITIPISADGENELHENPKSANLRLEKICQHCFRFPKETKTWIPRRFHDIRCMRSQACPTVTCLHIWMIHIHTHHTWIGLGSLKYITKNFLFHLCVILSSMLLKFTHNCWSQNYNVYVCKVHSLQLVCQHQFHTNCS